MRLFTMLFLPGLLLSCGKALSAYDPRQPEGLDLSFFGLTDEQFETLSRRLAVPFYGAAAVAMFLFGLVLSVLWERRPIWTFVVCTAVFIALEIGTLAYLRWVVRR